MERRDMIDEMVDSWLECHDAWDDDSAGEPDIDQIREWAGKFLELAFEARDSGMIDIPRWDRQQWARVGDIMHEINSGSSLIDFSDCSDELGIDGKTQHILKAIAEGVMQTPDFQLRQLLGSQPAL